MEKLNAKIHFRTNGVRCGREVGQTAGAGQEYEVRLRLAEGRVCEEEIPTLKFGR